jgi:hypothetical protein
MCADKEVREDGEITAETVLKEKVDYSWRLNNPLVSNANSFSHEYNDYMNDTWVKDFLEKMKIVWPLTSAYVDPANAETVAESESDTSFETFLTPPLPCSPQTIQDICDLPSFFTLDPAQVISSIEVVPQTQPQLGSQPLTTSGEQQKKLTRQADHYWPFMRCKNIYKAYGGTGRLRHYDLLKWVARKISVKLENMHITDPYTIKWLQGLPRR